LNVQIPYGVRELDRIKTQHVEERGKRLLGDEKKKGANLTRGIQKAIAVGLGIWTNKIRASQSKEGRKGK